MSYTKYTLFGLNVFGYAPTNIRMFDKSPGSLYYYLKSSLTLWDPEKTLYNRPHIKKLFGSKEEYQHLMRYLIGYYGQKIKIYPSEFDSEPAVLEEVLDDNEFKKNIWRLRIPVTVLEITDIFKTDPSIKNTLLWNIKSYGYAQSVSRAIARLGWMYRGLIFMPDKFVELFKIENKIDHSTSLRKIAYEPYESSDLKNFVDKTFKKKEPTSFLEHLKQVEKELHLNEEVEE